MYLTFTPSCGEHLTHYVDVNGKLLHLTLWHNPFVRESISDHL